MSRPVLRPAYLRTCLASLALLAGCMPAVRMAPPVRAIWVTRGEYRTPEDITRIMQNCAEAGFNTIVFQVRGNGTVFYPSKIEPWAEQFGFKDPGFNPLAVAIAEAHRNKLQLHAWINAMPAWRGTKPPSEPKQVYNTHPEWFWYDQKGNRQPLTDFYVSLNPCLPEVRAHIVSVIREVVANYDVDGIHLDYIRFPNEPPAIPAGSGIDYPRDARTLELYKQQTGKAPDDDEAAWSAWRTEQVTQLVRDIHKAMRRTRPGAALSASVGTSKRASLAHFRDELRWTQEGLCDAMFPMNYKSNLETFDQGLEMWLPLKDKVTVVPGLWFAPRLSPEEGVKVVKEQIGSASNKFGSFCVFSYGGLLGGAEARARRSDSRPSGVAASRPFGRRGQGGAGARELRQKELIPFIKSLAQKSGPVASTR